MIPKKPGEIIKLTAEQLQLPEELVEAIVYHYWEDIREKLRTLAAPRVPIIGLGWFDLKHWRLKYLIRDCKDILVRTDPTESIKSAAVYREIRARLEDAQNADKLCQEQQEMIKNVRKKRNELFKKTLESDTESQEDLGGN